MIVRQKSPGDTETLHKLFSEVYSDTMYGALDHTVGRRLEAYFQVRPLTAYTPSITGIFNFPDPFL